jgi:hypothetical protein
MLVILWFSPKKFHIDNVDLVFNCDLNHNLVGMLKFKFNSVSEKNLVYWFNPVSPSWCLFLNVKISWNFQQLYFKILWPFFNMPCATPQYHDNILLKYTRLIFVFKWTLIVIFTVRKLWRSIRFYWQFYT